MTIQQFEKKYPGVYAVYTLGKSTPDAVIPKQDNDFCNVATDTVLVTPNLEAKTDKRYRCIRDQLSSTVYRMIQCCSSATIVVGDPWKASGLIADGAVKIDGIRYWRLQQKRTGAFVFMRAEQPVPVLWLEEPQETL